MTEFLSILKIFWYINSMALIFTILLNNPKWGGSLSSSSEVFSGTKSAEKLINRITWSLVITFLFLTTLLTMATVNQYVITNEFIEL